MKGSRLTADTLHPLVGGLIVVLVALYMGYGYAVEKSANTDTYTISARFRTVDGVGVGTPVTLAGVRVGEVEGMEINPDDFAARLNLSIDKQYEIPIDSVAMIVSDGLVGGKYVKVAAGGELDMLEPGDEFEYVQDAVVMEKLLEKIIESAEARRAAEEQIN
ncbi:MAG: outer membrane lipid asymmetry maintenance protein MlaD [Alphaproteobacteria bacterium]